MVECFGGGSWRWKLAVEGWRGGEGADGMGWMSGSYHAAGWTQTTLVQGCFKLAVRLGSWASGRVALMIWGPLIKSEDGGNIRKRRRPFSPFLKSASRQTITVEGRRGP